MKSFVVTIGKKIPCIYVILLATAVLAAPKENPEKQDKRNLSSDLGIPSYSLDFPGYSNGLDTSVFESRMRQVAVANNQGYASEPQDERAKRSGSGSSHIQSSGSSIAVGNGSYTGWNLLSRLLCLFSCSS